jgi:lipopolysaccharide transport system ATP-binding protein
MAHSIAVNGLSKQYSIGASQRETMLRERLVNVLRRPFRRRETLPTIWALRDVSFSIGAGEIVGVIGRNGAGKSTLLKILSQITCPTAGTMTVKGRISSLLEVGTGFHDELTGRENVYMNGSILGMKKREVDAKLDAIVSFAAVEEFIDTPIKRYSSGMRLRLGFAVAAQLDPDILIVDEALAVGDSGFQRKCLNVMDDLRRTGRIVLLASHNMAAVEKLCSRAIWISGGKLEQDGPARDTVKSYMATFSGNDGRRSGTGDIRYTGVEFLSEDRQPKPCVRSGDSLVIRLHYRAEKPVPHPSFGVGLFTELGTLVTDTATWLHDIDIPHVPAGEGYVELEIDCLNLLPATYPLSLWLSGVDGVMHDLIEHCASLEVEVANVYRSDKIIDGRYGIAYFPQRWDLSGLRADNHDTLAIGSSLEVLG